MNGAYLLTDGDVQKLLESQPKKGKNTLDSFVKQGLNKKLPFSILENNEVSNSPEIHVKEGDLWFCLEGQTDFICGGKLAEGKPLQREDGTVVETEIQGTSILGGTVYTVKKGDWLWIPPGQPHQHRSKGLSRLLIIKIK